MFLTNRCPLTFVVSEDNKFFESTARGHEQFFQKKCGCMFLTNRYPLTFVVPEKAKVL